MEGMELGVRGWMVIIGVLLILAVVLDGYRRMRNERYANIKMSLKMGEQVSPEDAEIDELEWLSSELPNGGARVVGPGDINKAELGADALDPLFTEQPVPRYSHPDAPLAASSATAFADETAAAEEQSFEAAPISQAYETAASSLDQAREQASHRSDPQPVAEEIIIVHAMAKGDQLFNGDDLLKILLACDCRYGEKNIFHRYEEAGAEGAREFSIANVLEPGTFDLDSMRTFNTPGVSFILQLPGPQNPLQAYGYMIETAQCVAKNLGGELRDEMHSAVTSQTIEHNRERIREFERRKRLV